jgi:cation diffusion facilitator family transporter
VAGGVLIARESVAGLIEGKTLPSLKAGLLVMLLSTVVNLLISRHIFKVGKAVGSPALEADAWHLRTDVWTSLGIFLALSAIEIGRLVNPAWRLDFIDPACALAVSLLIVKTGASLGWDSVSTLIDNRLSPKELLLISDHIQAFYPRVLSYRRLRTRRAGPFRMVIVDLVVDGRLPVATAHALGQEVVMSICRHFPGADVTFHLEPSGHDDPVDAGGGPSPGDPTGGLARPRSEIKADLRTDFGDDLDVKTPAKPPRPEAGRPPSDRTGAASEAPSGAPGAAPSDVTSGTSSVASSDAPADASVPGGGAAAPGSGSDEPERGGPVPGGSRGGRGTS